DQRDDEPASKEHKVDIGSALAPDECGGECRLARSATARGIRGFAVFSVLWPYGVDDGVVAIGCRR
ncbi:MAG TPA: hypothetical protein VMV16_08655, partial [Solirubrobacteraceae bacterium]|nr:hypothetical protein [Solirubrobacteraceae bacterium]